VSAPVPIIGVSLGHRHEHTALSVTERAYVPTGEAFTSERRVGGYPGRTTLQARERVAAEYRVRHLERLPSRYAEVAQRIPEIAREVCRDFLLVADITATGRPAYSLILGELISGLEGTGIRFTHGPLTVTGVAGGVSKSPDVGHLVPRRDLISASQILFDAGQLKIAQDLELASTLRDELLAFRPKPPKPDDLEGWREGKDDDLVLAVACGVWAAERFLEKEDSVSLGSLGYPGVATG
jgi:hypothetical protein